MAQLMSIKKNVDVQPGAGVPAIFHCSQGDKGTRIILGLLNNNDSYTIPEGTTAIIRGSRADGTLFTEITADIDTTTEIKFNLTEDMTSVAGPVECEAVMSSGTANVIGTANFIIDVEKSPASIGSVFPGTDAATTWLIDKLENEPLNSLNGESVVDAINDRTGSGLTEDVKVALLACFEKVAWIDEDGQDYYDALYEALYPPTDLSYISAVFTQGQDVIYDTDSLNTLKQYLVVTAHMSDSTTQTVTGYALSGTLTEGTSTITVSYSGKTTTFTVNVTHQIAGWYYPFNNSLLSEGNKDFNLSGTGVYDDGLFNRKCYKHFTPTSGTASTDTQYGLSAKNLTDVLDYSKDFTISAWFKTQVNLYGHLYDQTIPVDSNFPSNRYFSNVSSLAEGWSVTNDRSRNYTAGILVYFLSNTSIGIRMSNSALTASSMLTITPPSSVDTTDWHHLAVTRKNTTVTVFFDGVPVVEATGADTTMYNSGQVAISTNFNSTTNEIQQMPNGDMIQDLYIAEYCKWESAFDPTEIVY